MADGEPIGVTVVWQGMRKRLWLSGPGGPRGAEDLKRAMMALDEEGETADDWRSFLETAVKVFKAHGFAWIDN